MLKANEMKGNTNDAWNQKKNYSLAKQSQKAERVQYP